MKHLTQEERYLIFSYLEIGKSKKYISEKLGRHISTIYREISRNEDIEGYDPKSANDFYIHRKKTAIKYLKLTKSVINLIIKYLKKDYSPEQISGYLKKEGKKSISPETIYKYILEDKLDGGNLYKHLRLSSNKKRKRYGSYDKRGIIKNRISINERPLVVDNKERIGDWEIDTVVGKGRSGYLITVVERKTKFTVIGFCKSKKALDIAKCIIKILYPYREKVKTITSDNGKEFAYHELVSKKLKCDFYFANPYHSWERGLNENTNGLIRQYLPKNYSFKDLTMKEVKKIQKLLNDRPRKTLNFYKPKELFKLE